MIAVDSCAQKEVQIMVNGPWAYAAPNASSGSMIYIVAPKSQHHGSVTIFSGEDAYDFNNPFNAGIEIDQTGQYTLTIPNIATCGFAPSGPPSLAYAIPIASRMIKLVLQLKAPTDIQYPCRNRAITQVVLKAVPKSTL